MHARMKVEAIVLSIPSPRPIAGEAKRPLPARIWTRLLLALHRSREREAARVIRRHRDRIQDLHPIEFFRP
jgi:hypothetical protein